MMIQEHLAGMESYMHYKKRDTSMKLICIEGLIAVGKSTLTKELAERMGARAMFEPLTENPYLERYYKDPKRYALEMQFWLMSRRFEMHEEAIRHIWRTGQSVIMDRSIYGDAVFAEKNWLDGNIDNAGFESYTHHRRVMTNYLLAPHIVIFLDAKVETCLERIVSRGRECERAIPLSYLKGLLELHINLMHDMKARGSKVAHLEWEKYGDVGALATSLRAL